MSNYGFERYLKSNGIDVVRTPVGDRYVLEKMREQGFNVGGEPSGHIILSDHTTTGDGFVAALQVMAVIKKRGEAVSSVCHRYDPLPQITKNVRYRDGRPHEHAKVRDAIAEGEHRLNGHGRLIVRASGTEPVIRVTVEGDDKDLVETVVDDIVHALNEVAA
jgi:phosphoglucosamine mutase